MIRLPRLFPTPQRHIQISHSLIRHRQIPLIIRSLRLRLRQTLLPSQELAVTIQGLIREPQGQMGPGLGIRNHGKPAVVARQGFQQLCRERGDGHRLAETRQCLQTPLPRRHSLIKVLTPLVVAHGLDAILQGVAFVPDAPDPVVARATAPFSMCRRFAQSGEALGGPAVHPGLAVNGTHHQRESRQAI